MSNSISKQTLFLNTVKHPKDTYLVITQNRLNQEQHILVYNTVKIPKKNKISISSRAI
jgi:hypothetical protein